MNAVQVVSALGNGVFVLAMLAVSVRLLLLWRRTRQLPELAVGAGFTLVSAVGFPLMAIGGIGRVAAGELWLGVVGLGLAAIGAGIVSLFVFTWQVFRPRDGAAAAFCLAALAAAAGIAGGALHTLALAPADADPIATGYAWWMALRLLFEAWYLWTGVESLREHARARRRLAIGLSDPVVANRFLLWGAMGTFLAAVNPVSMLLEHHGMSPVSDPTAALVLAANGLVAAGLMILTFMPPRAYVSFIRRRAARAAEA